MLAFEYPAPGGQGIRNRCNSGVCFFSTIILIFVTVIALNVSQGDYNHVTFTSDPGAAINASDVSHILDGLLLEIEEAAQQATVAAQNAHEASNAAAATEAEISGLETPELNDLFQQVSDFARDAADAEQAAQDAAGNAQDTLLDATEITSEAELHSLQTEAENAASRAHEASLRAQKAHDNAEDVQKSIQIALGNNAEIDQTIMETDAQAISRAAQEAAELADAEHLAQEAADAAADAATVAHAELLAHDAASNVQDISEAEQLVAQAEAAAKRTDTTLQSFINYTEAMTATAEAEIHSTEATVLREIVQAELTVNENTTVPVPVSNREVTAAATIKVETDKVNDLAKQAAREAKLAGEAAEDTKNAHNDAEAEEFAAKAQEHAQKARDAADNAKIALETAQNARANQLAAMDERVEAEKERLEAQKAEMLIQMEEAERYLENDGNILDMRFEEMWEIKQQEIIDAQEALEEQTKQVHEQREARLETQKQLLEDELEQARLIGQEEYEAERIRQRDRRMQEHFDKCPALHNGGSLGDWTVNGKSAPKICASCLFHLRLFEKTNNGVEYWQLLSTPGSLSIDLYNQWDDLIETYYNIAQTKEDRQVFLDQLDCLGLDITGGRPTLTKEPDGYFVIPEHREWQLGRGSYARKYDTKWWFPERVGLPVWEDPPPTEKELRLQREQAAFERELALERAKNQRTIENQRLELEAELRRRRAQFEAFKDMATQQMTMVQEIHKEEMQQLVKDRALDMADYKNRFKNSMQAKAKELGLHYFVRFHENDLNTDLENLTEHGNPFLLQVDMSKLEWR